MSEAFPFPTSSTDTAAQLSASKPAHDVVTAAGVTAIDAIDRGAALAQDALDRGIDTAHSAIERVVDTAAPAIQRVQEGVRTASDSLKSKSLHVRDSVDDLAEQGRSTVRANPFTSLGVALVAGFVVGRLIR